MLIIIIIIITIIIIVIVIIIITSSYTAPFLLTELLSALGTKTSINKMSTGLLPSSERVLVPRCGNPAIVNATKEMCLSARCMLPLLVSVTFSGFFMQPMHSALRRCSLSPGSQPVESGFYCTVKCTVR